MWNSFIVLLHYTLSTLIFGDLIVFCQKIQRIKVLLVCRVLSQREQQFAALRNQCLTFLGNRNVGKVIACGKGLACLSSLITNCQFVSLEILTAAPAPTQHYNKHPKNVCCCL